MKWWGRLMCSFGLHKWHEGHIIKFCKRLDCEAEERIYPGEHF